MRTQMATMDDGRHKLNDSLSVSLKIERLLEQGLYAYRAGEFRRAESVYVAVLEIDPGIPEAWHLLGLLRNDCNDVKHAMKLIRQAIDLDPANARYYYNLGVIFEKIGESHLAAELHRQAFQLDPELSDPVYDMHEVLVDKL